MLLPKYTFPGGGHGIFTDRNQRSNLGGYEYGKSIFFWVHVKAALFFGGGGGILNFWVHVLFTRYFSKHFFIISISCLTSAKLTIS